MLGLGSKLLGWVGLLGGIGAVVANSAGVVGHTASTVAGVVALVAAALGGSVARPTNTRATD